MSPNSRSSVVQRAIELRYDNKKRAASLRWLAVDALLLAVFTYDLWWWCSGASWWVEAACAVLAGSSALWHAGALLPSRRAALPVSPAQCALLALQPQLLDSSWVLRQQETQPPARTDTPPPDSPLAPRSPPSPLTPERAPPSPRAAPLPPDQFICERRHLDEYLRQQEDRARLGAPAHDSAPADAAAPWRAPPPSAYHLASQDTEVSAEEGARSPGVWRRVHLNPTRLTEFNLNLRLWLHVTILERLLREMDAVDAALAAAGLDARLHSSPADRLRALEGHVPALRALLPFLEVEGGGAYVARRVRALARGGALSEYRWAGGGPDWDDSKPTDAELLLHLFTTYLRTQGAGGTALGVVRARRRPPHYVVSGPDHTLEVEAGRNNLLHTLLVVLAAPPPALRRLQLGPAGLNVLWVIGR